MAAKYSVELCRKMVAAAEKALEKALEAQSYSIGGRSLSRASVDACQKTLDRWLNRLAAAESGNPYSGKPVVRSIIVHA